ncbi:MAG: hypothetical protein ACLGJC_28325, partial [Alphaproteobacteria bacterium]
RMVPIDPNVHMIGALSEYTDEPIEAWYAALAHVVHSQPDREAAGEPEVVLSAAPGAQPAQPDALKDERDLSKALMDLLKEIHEAPTMAAGYEKLADFTEHAGLGTPVPLRGAQPDAEERGVSDLPPGLVLVATPYRDWPDKWMLIEMTGPARAKVITGGCIENEAEGIAHAHNFAGTAPSASPASTEALTDPDQDAWHILDGRFTVNSSAGPREVGPGCVVIPEARYQALLSAYRAQSGADALTETAIDRAVRTLMLHKFGDDAAVMFDIPPDAPEHARSAVAARLAEARREVLAVAGALRSAGEGK